MDGLLIDSERLYRKYWKIAADDLGFDIADEQFDKLIGVTIRHQPYLIEEIFNDVQTHQTIAAHRKKLLERDYLEKLELKEGAIELLEFLGNYKVKLAIASSSGPKKGEMSLGKFNLFKYFEICMFNDKVERTKPFPDVHFKLLEHLNLNSQEALIIEDSKGGVEAAVAADIDVIWVKDLIDIPETHQKQCVANFNNLLEVIPFLKKNLKNN